ncbi:RyR domain-containing protein [Nocardia salmonicida]|uniref:RyR domain-containing protein n=1 Tax=Nocardia salmonicida TaxID=53431 RepID=UPI00366E88D0
MAASTTIKLGMIKTYRPTPMEITGILLTPDLNSLVELLAENAHDTWASMRIADGWQYGSERNDVDLLHPCLVSYNQFSEQEKEYDRRMVDGTVRAIIALGFEVRRP